MLSAEALATGSRLNPERLAWGVMLIAFAIFCALFMVVVVSVHYFFFLSTVPLHAQLQPARNSTEVRVGVSAVQSVRSPGFSLSSSATISTDSTDLLSQTTITFGDAASTEGLLALVTLMSDTTVRLNHSARPRFSWSASGNRIELTQLRGELDIQILQDLGRDLVVVTREGVRFRLSAVGSYRISASETQASVTNRAGAAVLILPGSLFGQSIPEGQRGIADLNIGEVQVRIDAASLIRNSALQTLALDGEDGAASEALIEWSCTNGANSPPRGSYGYALSPDARPAFRMFRGDGAISHGETLCEQRIGDTDPGLEIDGYTQLVVRARLYIANQSLNACGDLGSECPLMIRVDFINENGEAAYWVQGIYARRDQPTDLPLRCESCIQDHVLVYPDTWYLYQSDNLVELYRVPGTRIRSVTRVSFYASGHEYDVYVSEIGLYLGNTSQSTAALEAGRS
jgi:hypothetical protein